MQSERQSLYAEYPQLRFAQEQICTRIKWIMTLDIDGKMFLLIPSIILVCGIYA